LSFKTIRGQEQKRNRMCVLDIDEKGNLYIYKFALLCKNEIIKRLINGSYHLAESSDRPSTIGNSLIKLFSWHVCDLPMQATYSWNDRFILFTEEIVYTVKLWLNKPWGYYCTVFSLGHLQEALILNFRVLFCLKSWRYTGRAYFRRTRILRRRKTVLGMLQYVDNSACKRSSVPRKSCKIKGGFRWGDLVQDQWS